MKQVFYYLRDEENKPRITVCLMEVSLCHTRANLARGVAICSFKDNPSKSIGKAIAHGRAEKALKHGEPGDPVTRKEALAVYKCIRAATPKRFYMQMWRVLRTLSMKSASDPPLSRFEKRLLEKAPRYDTSICDFDEVRTMQKRLNDLSRNHISG